MAVVFVFVDGVGAGARDPGVNPLARGPFLLARFGDGSGTPLPHGGRAALADATLGVPGRPQSATGQATLLTGVNAPRQLGKHLLGFPSVPLRRLIEERSVFLELRRAGRRGILANAYPPAYLRACGLLPSRVEGALGSLALRRNYRPAATPLAYAAAGGRFFTWADARRGLALTHDLTGARANRYGACLLPRTPEAAARILLRIALTCDLTVFEFFETDEAGHARSMEGALRVLGTLDRFLRAVLVGLRPGDSLVVTSDHGNLEDLGTRSHTLAKVPVLGFGPSAARVEEVHDLTRVAPLLLRLAGAAHG